MRKLRLILINLVGVYSLCSCRSSTSLQTVAQVDINRYAGKWYEIGAYPQWFEKGCSNVTATYTVKEKYVEVLNACIKNDKPKSIKGKAFVVKNSGNAKLKVQFFFPFKGNYWIIDLADDYSWAVVSDPKRKTLWILSRTPQMDESVYTSITGSLTKNGFDLSKLKKTDQSLNMK
ncbi:MAG: lipocalin family protein [Paludibacteraceae bacterium]|nr:lipocalin family protein [Paludibacteraceae bacterium]